MGDPGGGCGRVILPREASDMRRWRRVLLATLVGLVMMVLVMWIGYGDLGDYGRPRGWVRFWAPIGLVLVAIGLAFNVRGYLVARGKVALVVFQRSPARFATPLRARLSATHWTDVESGAVITVDRHRMRTTGKGRHQLVYLRVESREEVKRTLTISNANLDFDWESWSREAFAYIPRLRVVAGEPPA